MANPQREDGHIDIANEIAEALMKVQINGYENRVLWAIFRKTYGWHKKEDWITNTQISNMTNIAESHISRTVRMLIDRNLVTKIGKKLSFQKDHEKWIELPKLVSSEKLPDLDIKLPDLVKENTKIGKKKLPDLVDTKETKETTTKETIQKITNTNFENPINNTKEGPKKAKKIEFDFELWSWHGVDQDIKERWANIFPHVDIEVALMDMREFFKKHPGHEKVIEEKFKGNYAVYIFDWLTRAERWKLEKLGKGGFNMPETAKGG